MDPRGAAAPCVGGAAGLSMEGEGETAGGRAVASRVGCCVFCVVFSVGP
jgi:hypothetical protein